MICGNCGFDNKEGAVNCAQCGEPLEEAPRTPGRRGPSEATEIGSADITDTGQSVPASPAQGATETGDRDRTEITAPSYASPASQAQATAPAAKRPNQKLLMGIGAAVLVVVLWLAFGRSKGTVTPPKANPTAVKTTKPADNAPATTQLNFNVCGSVDASQNCVDPGLTRFSDEPFVMWIEVKNAQAGDQIVLSYVNLDTGQAFGQDVAQPNGGPREVFSFPYGATFAPGRFEIDITYNGNSANPQTPYVLTLQ